MRTRWDAPTIIVASPSAAPEPPPTPLLPRGSRGVVSSPPGRAKTSPSPPTIPKKAADRTGGGGGEGGAGPGPRRGGRRRGRGRRRPRPALGGDEPAPGRRARARRRVGTPHALAVEHAALGRPRGRGRDGHRGL